MNQTSFQAGGALPLSALYVERPADQELLQGLLAGDPCHVLAPRQVGKSSLRVRARAALTRDGVRSVVIDLTTLGTQEGDGGSWYFGFIEEVSRRLGLPDPQRFWRKHALLPPVQRFGRYLREEVGAQGQRTVLFIDEIDALAGLPPRPRDDFFAALRALYDLRAEVSALRRLTLCLLGVVLPGDLISDPPRTPFNVGRAIRLYDFTRVQARALLPGLIGAGGDPEVLLTEILGWTSGHPYMTQRLCLALVAEAQEGRAVAAQDAAARVAALVQDLFLRPGRTLEPNLANAERQFKRMRSSAAPIGAMVRLYGRLLSGMEVVARDDDSVQMSLRLCGLAAEGDLTRPSGVRHLCVRNRIYGTVFDQAWVRAREVERIFGEPLHLWLQAGRAPEYLLGAAALKDMHIWAAGRDDVSASEREFLLASEQELQRARRRLFLLRTLSLAGAALLVLSTWALWNARQARRSQERAQAAQRQAEASMRTAQAQTAAAQARLPGGELPASLLSLQAVFAQTERRGDLPPSVLEGLIAATSRLTPFHVLGGKGAFLRTAAFSPDGALAFTGGDDGVGRLWDGGTGTLRGILASDKAPVPIQSAAFSPDGALVVTGDRDGALRVWDIHGVVETGRGRLIEILSASAAPLRAVGFLRASFVLVSVGEDGIVRLWELRGVFAGQGGRLLRAFPGGGQSLWTLATVPPQRPGPVPAVLEGDHGPEGLAHLIDDSLAMPARSATGAPLAPVDELVLLGGSDDVARLWQARPGQAEKLTQVLRGHWFAGIRSTAWSGDGRFLLTGSEDRTARLWDRRDGRLLRVFEGHNDGVATMALSPDGQTLATAAGTPFAAWLWDLSSGRHYRTLPGHADTIMATAFSPDGRRLLTASADGTARLWDLGQGRAPQPLVGHDGAVHGVATAPGIVLTGSSDGSARLWQVPTGRLLLTLTGHRGPVLAVALSTDGTRAFTGSTDGSARLWELPSGRLLRTFQSPTPIDAGDLSPDGALIVAGGRNGSNLWLWDVRDGRVVWRRPTERVGGRGDGVMSAVFSPDGRLMAAADFKDGDVWLWDLGVEAPRVPRPFRVLAGHLHPVWSLAFSHDGRYLATASTDSTARVWRVVDGQTVWRREGHDGMILGVAFSPDGAWLATGGADRTTRIWDLRQHQDRTALLTLQGHSGWVNGLAFSPEGRHLVTVSDDGTGRIYPTSADGYLDMACSFWSKQDAGASLSAEDVLAVRKACQSR